MGRVQWRESIRRAAGRGTHGAGEAPSIAMDLMSALSLGELALSFSRVPLFPVFDLSYFIVSIIYLKYEPGESGVVGVTGREVVHSLMTEAGGGGRLDPGAGWGRRQRLRSWSAPTRAQVEEGTRETEALWKGGCK